MMMKTRYFWIRYFWIRYFWIMPIVIVSLCLTSISALAVPGLIDYQGKLTNASDCVLTGTYPIIFRLYAGGTLKWEEEQTVTVDQGLFDVKLGSVVPFPSNLFENDDLDLETVIQNPDTGVWEPLSPQQHLTSAAYAIKADHAATATSASNATTAETATQADSATEAVHATTADSATNATNAANATNATNAANWTGSGGGTSAAPKVDWANNANNANNATNATNADYAATAGDAHTVDGKHAGEFLDTSGDTQTKSGGLNISGNVGIGTESPNEKLTVAGTIQSTSGGFKFPDGTLQATASSESGCSIPSGVIVMWSGSIANIPNGWALCDGTNGTPDLRDRFVVGAAQGANPGAKGGASSYNLSMAQMPSHNHAVSVNNTVYDPGHNHKYDRFDFPYAAPPNLSGIASMIETDSWQSFYTTTSKTGISVTASVNQSDRGSGAPIDNRPAYYALAFIMKL